jgi:P2 family phage contractile tail tube protein
MKFDQGLTNFKVYEGANDFYGMADVTLPPVNLQGDDISGAGIAGSFAAKYSGHVDAMEVEFNFRSVQKHLASLVEQRVHQITIMGSQQHRDNNSGILTDQPVKYILGGVPTSFELGKLAPASSTESKVKFSITYICVYLDGVKIIEIDQINFIYFINGTDYLANVRKNIGMN